MIDISIVSPVYQAEGIVPHLVRKIADAMEELVDSYEIILVEDRSRDRSWEAIRNECQKNKRVKGIRLSRNFGQHCAITAGLRHFRGDWIVVMDCDLQDQPNQIPVLYHKALQGFDAVYARRRSRKDPKSKRFYSRFFMQSLTTLPRQSKMHQSLTSESITIR
ncbi:MAG: glycosyltransferase family 2 protein [Synechococcaceae cyanobacterium]